jgi:hypothetical protein
MYGRSTSTQVYTTPLAHVQASHASWTDFRLNPLRPPDICAQNPYALSGKSGTRITESIRPLPNYRGIRLLRRLGTALFNRKLVPIQLGTTSVFRYSPHPRRAPLKNWPSLHHSVFAQRRSFDAVGGLACLLSAGRWDWMWVGVVGRTYGACHLRRLQLLISEHVLFKERLLLNPFGSYYLEVSDPVRDVL